MLGLKLTHVSERGPKLRIGYHLGILNKAIRFVIVVQSDSNLTNEHGFGLLWKINDQHGWPYVHY